MRLEIPKFRRCCFCVSLRHGIIIFGYLNLTSCILMIYFDLWLLVLKDFKYPMTSGMHVFYRGVSMYMPIWFIVLLMLSEVALNVVLLVGAHKKTSRSLSVYYYYGIMTTVAAFVTYIVMLFINHFEDFEMLAITLAFTGIVLEIYLLLLIRSELEKEESPYQLSFVNHLSEVTLCPRST